MTLQYAIETRSLSHAYGEHRALEDVSLQVPAGSLFGLLGPNGGGKTTLFRILSTLMAPESGSAQVMGLDVTAKPAEVRRRIGVVFQAHTSDPLLSVQENFVHFGRLYGLTASATKRRAAALADRMGLASRLKDRVAGLSGGLRRRLELGLGLLHEPELLLLDEPTSGLDAGARRDFKRTLRELAREGGMTVLLTTHLMDEAEICDRLAILDHGRLVAEGTPAELKATIGGDVLTMESPDAAALREAIESRFGGGPTIVDGKVRLERAEGHTFVSELIETFPGQVDSITVSKPTLEDVFAHQTGHGFWEASEKEDII